MQKTKTKQRHRSTKPTVVPTMTAVLKCGIAEVEDEDEAENKDKVDDRDKVEDRVENKDGVENKVKVEDKVKVEGKVGVKDEAVVEVITGDFDDGVDVELETFRDCQR